MFQTIFLIYKKNILERLNLFMLKVIKFYSDFPKKKDLPPRILSDDLVGFGLSQEEAEERRPSVRPHSVHRQSAHGARDARSRGCLNKRFFRNNLS